MLNPSFIGSPHGVLHASESRAPVSYTHLELGELLQGDAFLADPIVGGVDDDGQGVGADAELERLAADGLAAFNFGILDGAGGVGDVGLASLAEALEAGAGADGVDRDVAAVTLVDDCLLYTSRCV